MAQKQYEYKVISIPDVSHITLEVTLNEKGEDGWELINITGGPTVYYYFFKRLVSTHF